MGSEALYANRQGVDTAGHNIANAQTEGFSRQRVNLSQRDPSEARGITIGNGVFIKGITRAHDKFIEKQLNVATQESSLSEAKHEALQVIEEIYSTETQSSIADGITGFFTALQNLSANPEEQTTRTVVREAARDMISSFNRVDYGLKRHQSDLNEQMRGTCEQVDDLIRQIAELNVSILAMEAGRAEQANDLRDQQDRLVRTLSEKIDINTYSNEHGALVIRGPQQVLLVDGKSAGRIYVQPDVKTGHNQVVASDAEGHGLRNLTEYIERGELKALLDVRDKLIPELTKQNDILAATIATNINIIHREGYGTGDYKESRGRDFFDLGGSVDGASGQLKLSASVAEDLNAISAAATPSAPGDNVIVNDILRMRSERVLNNSSMTFNEFYSNYVGNLGLEIERSGNQMNADKIIVGDLSKRREAISGVSLDEEAVNLLRWQTAFAASSKVITTTDEMLETVLSLKR